MNHDDYWRLSPQHQRDGLAQNSPTFSMNNQDDLDLWEQLHQPPLFHEQYRQDLDSGYNINSIPEPLPYRNRKNKHRRRGNVHRKQVRSRVRKRYRKENPLRKRVKRWPREEYFPQMEYYPTHISDSSFDSFTCNYEDAYPGHSFY